VTLAQTRNRIRRITCDIKHDRILPRNWIRHNGRTQPSSIQIGENAVICKGEKDPPRRDSRLRSRPQFSPEIGQVRKTEFLRVERMGLEPTTSALRTHRARVLSVDTKQVTPTVSNGCTNGCTSSTKNANETLPTLDDATHSKCLELLASHSELLALVEAWPELSDALRAGVMAMVRAASG